jgi:hypothetical protein
MKISGVGWILLLIFLTAGSLSAQYYYEKNKIQREVEPTYTYETEHFSIYIEEGGEPLAAFAAEVIEAAYSQHSADFGFDIPIKIPVIIYKSQPDFAATNIILQPIEESVGGFSELFKNRVVVPFTGSYDDLHHVLYHELTHIFQFELYFSLTMSNIFSLIPGFSPPLWIMEGSAEFSSTHGGEASDAFMRDLLISNNVIPLEEFEYWGGYVVYRQGESVFLFIEERYGREKVFELLHAIKLRTNMDAAFEKVFGMDVEDFGVDWLNWLRLRYVSDIEKLENRKTQARLLTDHVEDFSYYNGSVALSASGTKIAYATSKGDYITVNVISGFDGKPLKKLIKAGRSATFERLPLLRRTLAWSADETHLAAIGFSRNKPVLLWVNYASGKTEKRYPLKVDDAYAPVVSVSGSRIVYVGVNEGQSDLYSLDLASGRIERLTFDLYEEADPSFDGEHILYVSDKPDADNTWEIGSYAVWELLPSGRTKRISPRFSNLSSPYRIGDEVFFIGQDFQLCSYSAEDSTLTPVTDWFEKVEEFSPAANGKAALLVYNNSGWDVAMLNGTISSLSPPQDTGGLAPAGAPGFLYEIEEVTIEDFKRYRASFSPDYIYGSGAYSSLYGAFGELSLGISDMLGDHRIYIDANLMGDILYSNLSVSYWYLKHRVDFAVGAFQYPNFYMYWTSDSTFTYIESARRGVSTLASFPFSKFFRFETGVDGMAVTEKEYLDCRFDQYGRIVYDTGNVTVSTRPLFQGSGWLVFDNALWKYTTPMVGLRMRLGGYSSFLSPLRYQTVMADLRGYLPVTRRASFALRTFGGASFGEDNEYFTLGGAYDVRGYSTYYPDIGSRVVFSNLELRVPFLDQISMAFPFPVTLSGIRGIVFTDAGVIWNDELPVLWQGRELIDLKASYGAGMRWLFGYFMLKLDFARPYQKLNPDDKGWDVWRVHFRLGADF